MSDWPVKNAIACLKETQEVAVRHAESARRVAAGEGCASIETHPMNVEAQKQEVIVKAMDYAIEIIKGIESKREPVPPTPEEIARKGVQEFCKELGRLFENLGAVFGDIASGDIPEGWNPWEQKWE